MVRDIYEFFAIGREVILKRAAKLKCRRVEIAGCQVSGLSGSDIGQEYMSSSAVLPFIPVAIKQVVGHVSFERPVVPGLRYSLVAGVVAAAFRIDIGGEGDRFSVRRPQRIGYTG